MIDFIMTWCGCISYGVLLFTIAHLANDIKEYGLIFLAITVSISSGGAAFEILRNLNLIKCATC